MKKNDQKALEQRVNQYLHSVGPDGTYNRDRIAAAAGLPADANGVRIHGKISDQQRAAFQAQLEKELGFSVKNAGLELDQNLNLNGEGMSGLKKGLIAAAIGGAAATGLGAAGIGPLSGILGGGSAAAAGGGAAASTGAGAGTAATTAGVVGGALKTSDVVRDILKAGAAGAAGYGDHAANERGVQTDIDAQNQEARIAADRDYNAAVVDREKQADDRYRNANRDAMHAAYVQGAPSSISGPGVSPYSKPIAGPNDAQRGVAAQAKATADRILADRYADLPDVSRTSEDIKYREPGTAEKISNVGSIAGGIASALPGSTLAKLAALLGGKFHK